MSYTTRHTATRDPGLIVILPGFASRLREWLAEAHDEGSAADHGGMPGTGGSSSFSFGRIADAF
jgi:hypothetical protein